MIQENSQVLVKIKKTILLNNKLILIGEIKVLVI